MSDTDNQKPTLPADPLELITKAGKLNYSIEQMVVLVCSKFPKQNRESLFKLLTTPGNLEFESYKTGKSLRLFDVEDALYDAATSGDVDAGSTTQGIANPQRRCL